MPNIVKKKVRNMTDSPFVVRSKAVYGRILKVYKADNANQLAKRVEHLGIGRTTVYDWEKGTSEPSEENLNLISKDTGESVYALLGLEENPIDLEGVGLEAVNQFLIEQVQNIKQKITKREKKKKAS